MEFVWRNDGGRLEEKIGESEVNVLINLMLNGGLQSIPWLRQKAEIGVKMSAARSQCSLNESQRSKSRSKVMVGAL